MPRHAHIKENDEFKYNRVPTLRSFYSRDGTPPALKKRPPAPTPPPQTLLRPRPTHLPLAPVHAPPMAEGPKAQHLDMRCFLEQLYVQRGYPYREEPQYQYYILPSETREHHQYPCEVLFDSYPTTSPVIHREYRIPNILERSLRDDWPEVVDRYSVRSDEAKLLASSLSSRSDQYGYASPKRKRKLRVKKKKRHKHEKERETERSRGWYSNTNGRKRVIGARKTVRSNNSTRVYERIPGSKTTIDESLGLDSDAKMLLTEYESVTISSKELPKKYHRIHSSTRQRSSFNKDQGGKVIFIETDFSSMSKADSSITSCHRNTTVPVISKEMKKKISHDSETPDSAFYSRNKTSPSSNNISKEEIKEIFVDKKMHSAGISVSQSFDRKQQSFTSPLYKPQDVVCTKLKVEEMGVVIEELDTTELQEKHNEPEAPLSVVHFKYIMPENVSEQNPGDDYVPTIQSEPNLTVISGNEISNYWKNAVKTALGTKDNEYSENLQEKDIESRSRIINEKPQPTVIKVNNLPLHAHDSITSNVTSLTFKPVNAKNSFNGGSANEMIRDTVEQNIIPQKIAEPQTLPTKLLFDDFAKSIGKEVEIAKQPEGCSNPINKNTLYNTSPQNATLNKTREETEQNCERVLEIIDIAPVDPEELVTQRNEDTFQPAQNISLCTSHALCCSSDREEFVKINNRFFRVSEGNVFQEVPREARSIFLQKGKTYETIHPCQEAVEGSIICLDDRKIQPNKTEQSVNRTDHINAACNLPSVPSPNPRSELNRSPQKLEFQNDPNSKRVDQPTLDSLAGELIISSQEPSTFSKRAGTISDPEESISSNHIGCKVIECNISRVTNETNCIPLCEEFRSHCDGHFPIPRGDDNSVKVRPEQKICSEQQFANNISGFRKTWGHIVQKKRTLPYRGVKIPLKRFEKDKLSKLQKNSQMSNKIKVAPAASEIPIENINIPIGRDIRACTSLDISHKTNVIGDGCLHWGESPQTVNYPTAISAQHTVSLEKVLVVSDIKEQTFRMKGPNNNVSTELQTLCNTRTASREYINVSQHIFKCPLIQAMNCSKVNSSRGSDSSFENSSRMSSTSAVSTPPVHTIQSSSSDLSCKENSTSSVHYSNDETPSANVSVSSIEMQEDNSIEPGVMIWEMCNKRMYRDNEVTMLVTSSAGEIYVDRHSLTNISGDISKDNDIPFSTENNILPSITEEKSYKTLKGKIEESSSGKNDEGESVVGLLQQIVRHLSCIGQPRSASSCSAATSPPARSATDSLENIRNAENNEVMCSNQSIALTQISRPKSDQTPPVDIVCEGERQDDIKQPLMIPIISKNNDLNDKHSVESKQTCEQRSFDERSICKNNENDSSMLCGIQPRCISECLSAVIDNTNKRSNKNLSPICGSCNLHREYLRINNTHSSNAISENTIKLNANSSMKNSKVNLYIGCKHSDDSTDLTSTENEIQNALPSDGGIRNSLNLSDGNPINCPPSNVSQAADATVEKDGLCMFISRSTTSSTDVEKNVKSCLVYCEGRQTTEELKQFRLSGGSSPKGDRIRLHRSGKWHISCSGSGRSHNQYSARRHSSENGRNVPLRSFRHDSQNHLTTARRCLTNYSEKSEYSNTSEEDTQKSSKTHRPHRFLRFSRAKGDDRDTISGSRKFYNRGGSDTSSNASSRSAIARSSRTRSLFEAIPEYPYSSSSSSEESTLRRNKRYSKRRDQGSATNAKKCFSCILENIPSLANHLILHDNCIDSEDSIARRAHSVGGRSNMRAMYAQTYTKPNSQIQRQLSNVDQFLKLKESSSTPLDRQLIYSGSVPLSSATEISYSSNDPTSVASASLLGEMKLCIDRIEERCIEIEKNHKASSEKTSRSVTPQSGYHRMCTASPISLSHTQPPTVPWSTQESILVSTQNSAKERNSATSREKIDDGNTCGFHQVLQKQFNRSFSRDHSESLMAIDFCRLSQGTQAEFKKPERCEVGVETDVLHKCKFCEMKTQTEEFKLYEKGIQVLIEEILGVAKTCTPQANQLKDQKRNLCDSSVQWEYPEEELRQISLGAIEKIKHEIRDSAIQCAIMRFGKLMSQSSQTDFKVHKSKSVQSEYINLIESGVQLDVSELISRGVQAYAPTETSVQVLKKKESFSQTDSTKEDVLGSEIRHSSRQAGNDQWGRGYQERRGSLQPEGDCVTCPQRNPDRCSAWPPQGRQSRPNQYGTGGYEDRPRNSRFKMCKRCVGVNPPCTRMQSTCPNTYVVDDVTQMRIEEHMRSTPSGGAGSGRFRGRADCECVGPGGTRKPRFGEEIYCGCPKGSASYPSQEYRRDQYPAQPLADYYGPPRGPRDHPPSDKRYRQLVDSRPYGPPSDGGYGPPSESGRYGPPSDDESYRPMTADSRGYGPPPSDSRDYGAPPSDSKGHRRSSRDYGAPPPDTRSYGPPQYDTKSYGPPPSDDARGYRPPPTDTRDYRPPPSDLQDYGPPTSDDRSYEPHPPPDERDYRPPPSETQRYGPPPSKGRDHRKPPSDTRDYGPSSDDRDYGKTPPEAHDYGPSPPDRKDYGPPPSDTRGRELPLSNTRGYKTHQDSREYEQPPSDTRDYGQLDDKPDYRSQPPRAEDYEQPPSEKYGPPLDAHPPTKPSDSTNDVSDSREDIPPRESPDYGPPPHDTYRGDSSRPGESDDGNYPPARRNTGEYDPPREYPPSQAYSRDHPSDGDAIPPRRPSQDYPPARDGTPPRRPSQDYPPARDATPPLRPSQDYPPPQEHSRRDSRGYGPTRSYPPSDRENQVYSPPIGDYPPPQREAAPGGAPKPEERPDERDGVDYGPRGSPSAYASRDTMQPRPYSGPPSTDTRDTTLPPGDIYGQPPSRGDPYGRHAEHGGPYGGPPTRGDPYGEPPGRGESYGRPPIRGDPYRGPPQQDVSYGGPPERGDPYGEPPGRGAPYEREPERGDPYAGPTSRGEPYGRPPTRGEPYERSPQRDEPYGEAPPGGRRPGEQARDPYAGAGPRSGPEPWVRDARAPDDEREVRVWMPPASSDRSRPASAAPRPCEDDVCVKRRERKRRGFWRCFRRKPRPPESPPPDEKEPRRPPSGRPQSGPPSRADRQDDAYERQPSRPPSAPPRSRESPSDERHEPKKKKKSKCGRKRSRSRRPSDSSRDPYNSSYPPPRDRSRDPEDSSYPSPRDRSRDPYDTSRPPRASYQDPYDSSRRPRASFRDPYDSSYPPRRDSSPPRRYDEEPSDRSRDRKKKKSKCGRKRSKSPSRRDSRDPYDSSRSRDQSRDPSRDPYDSSRPRDQSREPYRDPYDSSRRSRDPYDSSSPARRDSSAPRRYEEEPLDSSRERKKKKKKSKCRRKRSKSRSPRRYSQDSSNSPHERGRDSYDMSRRNLSRGPYDLSCPTPDSCRDPNVSSRPPRDQYHDPYDRSRPRDSSRDPNNPLHSLRDSSRDPYDSTRPPRDQYHDPYDPSRPARDSSRDPYDTTRPPRDQNRDPYDSSHPPGDSSRVPYDYSRPPSDQYREPYDSSRAPRDSSRDPYYSSRPPADSSRDPNDSSRPPRDTSREPFDSSRPPRDTSRETYDSSRPPRDTSREPYDSSRPPRDQYRDPYDSSRPPRDSSRDPYDTTRPPGDSSRDPYDSSRLPRQDPYDNSYPPPYDSFRKPSYPPRRVSQRDTPSRQQSLPPDGAPGGETINCDPVCFPNATQFQPAGSRPVVCVNVPVQYQSTDEEVIYCKDLRND